MSKIIDNIYRLHNNPFIFTPIIIEFYKNYYGQKNDILLSYLVLPLVLHEETRNTLKYTKVTSSLYTFGRKKENYFGLQDRIGEYIEITNMCLQNAIDNEFIKIDDNLQIHVIKKQTKLEPDIKDFIKAASNLPKLIKDFDVVAVYRLLGVKKL